MDCQNCRKPLGMASFNAGDLVTGYKTIYVRCTVCGRDTRIDIKVTDYELEGKDPYG